MLASLFISCAEQQTENQAPTSPASPLDNIDWDKAANEAYDDSVTVVPEEYIDFEYKRVIAFATVDPFDHEGVWETMDISKFQDTLSKTLSKKQIAALDDLLSGRHRKSYRQEPGADCFNPRHNIAFLDKKDSVVNFVSICFEYGTSAQSKNFLANHDDLRAFFNEIGFKVFDDPGDHRQYYDSLMGHKEKRSYRGGSQE